MNELGSRPDGQVPEIDEPRASESKLLSTLAAMSSGVSGVLGIGALVFPIKAIHLTDHSSFVQTSKTWLTGRYSTVVSGDPGLPSRRYKGTTGSSAWPLSVICILALLAVAVMILVRQDRWRCLTTGLLTFALCWTGFAVVEVVSASEGDAGAGVDQVVDVAAGWWFLLTSDVLICAALILLWLAWAKGNSRTIQRP